MTQDRLISSSPGKGEELKEGVASRFNRTPEKTRRARGLRARMPDAEHKLWARLRRGGLAGYRFRRQHPAGNYILDFYCPSLRLAIELDGGQHGADEALEKDALRDAWLESQGVTVLRIWNADVFRNPEGVIEQIGEMAHWLDKGGVKPMTSWRAAATPSGPAGHLPLAGGGDNPIQADEIEDN